MTVERDQTHMTRRLFLQAVAAGVTVSAMPAWLAEPAAAATPLGRHDGVLVLATMAGGNDGLNTFIPTTSGAYHDARRGLAIGPRQALPMSTNRGLHPELSYFKRLWDKGDLAVIDGVGQAGSSLSHFESMAKVMMATQRPAALGTGWLGRYLDGLPAGQFNGVSLGATIPLLLKGRARQAIGLPHHQDGIFDVSDTTTTYARQYRALRAMGTSPTGLGPLADAISQAGRRAVDLAGTVRPLLEDDKDEPTVVTRFRLAARLINADLGVRVISIVFGDFDSHANQHRMHRDRMTELNDGVRTFYDHLDPAFATRTLVVGTSEFGRRVRYNGSGTDHGQGNSLFAIGHQVNGGLHGELPSLTRLDSQGNLIPTVTFQTFYANLVSTWLRADAREVIGQDGDLGFLNPPGRAISGKRPPAIADARPDRVERRAQLARLYLASFGALPDEGAIDHWSNALLAESRSLQSIAAEIGSSDRFVRRYGSLSDRRFVEIVYRNVLNRPADANGMSHWEDRLRRGTTRGAMMVSFSESAEFKQRSAGQVWRFELVGPVGRLYRAYFLRRPDDRGLRHWINTGLPLGSVSNTFAHSIEFLNRYGTLTNEEFVQLVYRNVLGRPAEANGYHYWLGQLNRGKPRGSIMLGFSNSIEFIKKVESLTP